jgi:hypothetical protein
MQNKIALVHTFLFPTLLIATQSHAGPFHLPSIPHLDPEMTSVEYERALALAPKKNKASDPVLQKILTLGKRNLDWLEAVNSARSASDRLELSNPALAAGIPIDQPSKSSGTLIKTNFQAFQNSVDPAFMQVLNATTPVPTTSVGSDSDFIAAVRKLDRLYQKTSRWLLQEPYLMAYAQRASGDIRGYYFLAKEPNLESKLKNWSQQPQALRDQLEPWLVGQCLNSGTSASTCKSQFKQALGASALGAWNFFSQHLIKARKAYNDYFVVQNPRSEAYWEKNLPEFVLPFKTPATVEQADWFKFNVEDEWKVTNLFSLRIDFRNQAFGLAELVFKPGATPNVNGLGGSTITMDSNRPIQEYLTRWTIRHEFGHVLGFPDCYIEFYDSTEAVMINYQIDVDNLMCSRKGHLLPVHLDALKAAYPN